MQSSVCTISMYYQSTLYIYSALATSIVQIVLAHTLVTFDAGKCKGTYL